jgi:hypothetical protein
MGAVWCIDVYMMVCHAELCDATMIKRVSGSRLSGMACRRQLQLSRLLYQQS